MTKEQYKQAGILFEQIREKNSELELVNHLVSNIQGATAKVKINSQWIIDLPIQALKGHAITRKIQLESELTNLKNQLNMI